MKSKFVKILAAIIVCFAVLTGCGVVVPTPSPTIEPTPTPDNTMINIVVGLRNHVNNNNKRLELIETILRTNFRLNVVDYVDYNSGAKMDVIFKASPDDTNFYTEDGAIKSTSSVVEDSFNFGIAHNVINYLDYMDKMPNYTSRFHRKDIYITQLYEDSALASPYAVGGWMFELPLIGGFEGEPLGVWMYNEDWFYFKDMSTASNIEDIIDFLIEYKQTNNTGPLVISDVVDEDKGVGITPLLTGIAASLGVDVDFLNEINTVTKGYASAEWQEQIVNMLTLNEEGRLEFTLNTQAYLKALELYRKLIDNNLVTFAEAGSISGNDIDNYVVAYVPLDYRYENNPDAFDGSDNLLISRNYWTCAETQFSADENTYVNTFGDTTQNMGTGIYIVDQEDQRIIDRLISFVDWCCSEEGILLLNYGKEDTAWYYDYNTQIRFMRFNKRFVNDALRSTADSTTPSGDSLFQPISANEVSRLMAHRVAIYEYCPNSVVRDLNRYNSLGDHKLNKQTKATGLTYVESLDPTLFSMEVSSTDYTNTMYLPIKNVIRIVTEFYEGFISGRLSAADFEGYCNALEAEGINDIVAYIEGVYENAYSKYNIPEILS